MSNLIKVTANLTVDRSLVERALEHCDLPKLMAQDPIIAGEFAKAMVNSQMDILDFEAVDEMWDNDVFGKLERAYGAEFYHIVLNGDLGVKSATLIPPTDKNADELLRERCDANSGYEYVPAENVALSRKCKTTGERHLVVRGGQQYAAVTLSNNGLEDEVLRDHNFDYEDVVRSTSFINNVRSEDGYTVKCREIDADTFMIIVNSSVMNSI